MLAEADKSNDLAFQQENYGLAIKSPLPFILNQYSGLFLPKSYGDLVKKIPSGSTNDVQSSSIVALHQVSGSGKHNLDSSINIF